MDGKRVNRPLLNRQTSQDAPVFKSRLIYAANMVAAFWLGIASYFPIVIFFMWRGFKDEQRFRNDETLCVILLANGILVVLVLVFGRLLAMWPYAVVLEPQKGIWVYAPPTKLWIPLDEIVDIDVYSGGYGGGHRGPIKPVARPRQAALLRLTFHN
jgi:hypothetical protein